MKTIFKLLFGLCLVFYYGQSFSQMYALTYTDGTGGNKSFTKVITNASGTNTYAIGNQDTGAAAVVCKVNTQGVPIWTLRVTNPLLNDPNNSQSMVTPRTILFANDATGDIIVGGDYQAAANGATSSVPQYNIWWIARIDSNGAVVWSQSYDYTPAGETPRLLVDIVATTNINRYIVGGRTFITNSGNSRCDNIAFFQIDGNGSRVGTTANHVIHTMRIQQNNTTTNVSDIQLIKMLADQSGGAYFVGNESPTTPGTGSFSPMIGNVSFTAGTGEGNIILERYMTNFPNITGIESDGVNLILVGQGRLVVGGVGNDSIYILTQPIADLFTTNNLNRNVKKFLMTGTAGNVDVYLVGPNQIRICADRTIAPNVVRSYLSNILTYNPIGITNTSIDMYSLPNQRFSGRPALLSTELIIPGRELGNAVLTKRSFLDFINDTTSCNARIIARDTLIEGTWTRVSITPVMDSLLSILALVNVDTVIYASAALCACTPPSLTTPPSAASICLGQSHTFSVTATGTGTLSYQWFLNGSAIANATNATYTSSVVGNYTVTVSNACGAATSNIATLSITILPTPTIVGGSPNFCAGSGQNYQVLNPVAGTLYTWSVLQGANTIYTTTGTSYYFTTPTAGYYTLQVTATSASGCVSQPASMPVTVFLVPDAPILVVSDDPCLGQTQIVTISNMSSYASNMTVEWLLDGVAQLTNAFSFASTWSVVGTHTVTVNITSPYGCVASASASTEVADCCPSANDKIFTHIGLNTVFNPGTNFLLGKYYVEDMITIPQGVILDMTNVDMVFDEDAGLSFPETSSIYAYNSVFRPCNENSFWQGMITSLNTTGNVKECTYINAVNGIHVSNDISESLACGGIEIVNNLFTNCETGLNFSYKTDYNAYFCKAISGNTFEVDYIHSPFQVHHGIVLNGVRVERISQNDFIAGIRADEKKSFGGVEVFEGGSVISTNNFSNNTISIFVQNPSSTVAIESNRIETTKEMSFTHVGQIYVQENNNSVFVLNNELRSSGNELGMYFEGGYGTLFVQKNTLRGMDFGIYGLNLNGKEHPVCIVENDIEGISGMDYASYGIFMEDCYYTKVNCNKIKMGLAPHSLGIDMHQTGKDNYFNTLEGNCISDCDRAMIVRSDAADAPIPSIRNNYLFNYTTVGLDVVNHIGGVGAGCNTTNAGYNSFVSNNQNTMDLVSSQLIGVAGNWGLSNITGMSSLNCNDDYSSTASCGTQAILGNHNSVFPYQCVTDWTAKGKKIAFAQGSTSPQIIDAEVEEAIEIAANKTVIANNFLSDYLAQNQEKKAEELFTLLLSKYKQANWMNWVAYHYLSTTGKLTEATSYLSKVIPANSEEAELKQIETIVIGMKKAKRTKLNETEVAFLRSIENGNTANHKYADGLLYFFNGEPLTPNTYTAPALSVYKASDVIRLKDSKLTIYPNPAQNIIHVTCTIGEGKGELAIVNMLGQTVETLAIDFEAKSFEWNLESLPAGTYNLIVRGASEEINPIKFVKMP